MFISNYPQAEQAYRQALLIYEDAGKPAECLSLKIEVTNGLAFILSLTGKPSESIKMAQENLRRSDLEFDQIGKIGANIQIAINQYYLGNYRQAICTAGKSLESATAFRNGRMMMYLHLIIARSALAMGRIAECWQHLQSIKELERKYSCIEVSRTAHTVCGELYSSLGAYKLAIKEFEDGISSFSNSLEVLDNRLHFGMMLRYLGEIQRGDQMVKTALNEAQAKKFASIYLLGELYDVFWYIRTGKDKEGQQLIDIYERDIISSDMRAPKLCLQLIKSHLAKHNHQLDRAKAFAQQVVNDSIEINHVWMELHGRRILWELTHNKREKQVQAEEIDMKIENMTEGIQEASISGLLNKFKKRIFDRRDA
jgi:tetratricopeptide (TPR) repeat protein